jgi:hypothetical protein
VNSLIATTDCTHSWSEPGPQRVAFTIDAWQGLTDGLIQCATCGQYAVVNLLDWGGRNLCFRIFSVALAGSSTASVFLRNMNSDYCDLSRHQAEANALLAATERPCRLILAGVPGLNVITSRPVVERKPEPTFWRESIPNGETWFPLFDFDCAPS